MSLPSNNLAFYDMGKLIFLKAVTPVHVGIGRTYGEAVDLPVQRDEFGIPVIWGSSLKGTIRAQKERIFKSKKDESIIIKALFGPDESDTGKIIESASSISILDARLLLIPARSLRGVYAYVTSPHLLHHLENYIRIISKCCKKHSTVLNEILEALTKIIDKVKNIREGYAFATSDKCIVDLEGNRKVILNEIPFNVQIDNQLKLLFRKIVPEEILDDSELDKIFVISDEDIYDVCMRSMQVITRVRIDYETKTVKRGALWSEEYLPSNTILVSALLLSFPRILEKCREGEFKNEDSKKVCEIIMKYAKNIDELWNNYVDPRDYLILGGHETIGKGIVQVVRI